MKLYFKGVEYDIPIQKDWELTFAIDGTLSSGYVETAPLENNMGALDLSRRIPRGLLVKLERNSRTFYMVTSEVVANKVSFVNGKYKHMINLISLEKQLQRLPLENITVTQPKGDLGTYTRSVNNISAPIAMTSSGAVNETVTSTPTYINIVNDNTSIIDGLEVKVAKLYSISLRSELSQPAGILPTNITIRIKYNGGVVATNIATIPANLFKKSIITDIINLKLNITTLSTFSVEYEYTTSLETTKTIESSTLSILAVDVVDKPIQTYAQVIDKALRNTDYILSPKSRTRLNLTCPEYKFEEYTIYDVLSTIGGFVGAIVKVGDEVDRRLWTKTSNTSYDIEGDSLGEFNPYDWAIGTIVKVGIRYYINSVGEGLVREINFEFFDRPNVVDIPYNTRHEIAELEDYTSAVELNTKNVVKPLRYSPFKGGWKGVRSNGIGQQTTDNIIYELEDVGDNIVSVKVKGRIGKNSSGTIIYTEDDVTDITSRVVNKKLYDTLAKEKNVDYTNTGKKQLRQHNTLYHQQGSKFIEGLTYLGEDLSQVVGDPSVIRAVYEAIDAVRSIEQDELITLTGTDGSINENDEGIDGDIKLRFQVTYANITESRARVYKDDQSTFEQQTIKYLNESANINESQAIGDYAQLIVNRLGGTKIVYRGIVDDINELPEVGDIDSEGRVYTLIKLTIGTKVKYEITAVQDYNVISSYIGIVSRHRNEEISSSDSVLRTLRYVNPFAFVPTQQTFSSRFISSEDILSSLVENTDLGLNYAYLETNLSNGSNKKVHLSVDSDNKGKTIEIKMRLKDNYSAGLKRYAETIGGNTVYLNKEVEYTDLYGKVNDILLNVYYDTTAFTTADDEAYPEALSDKGNTPFAIITDTIDKDARETIAFLIEVPIFSQDPEIQVYNGFAKYNKLVEGTDNIRVAILQYIPRKNDKIVDQTRIIDLGKATVGNVDSGLTSGSYSFGKLSFGFTSPSSGQGLVWYHNDTLELVLAYIKPLAPGGHSATKYYIMDSATIISGGGFNGGGESFVQSIAYLIVYSGEIEQSSSTMQQLEGIIDISNENTEGLNYFDEVNIKYQIIGDLNQSFNSMQQLDSVIELELDTILGQDEYGINYVQYQTIGTLAQSTNMIQQLEGIINFERSLIDAIYQWVSGGTTPTTSQTCAIASDVGNVRCDLVPASCNWVYFSSYESLTDETVNDSASCFVENSKVICSEYTRVVIVGTGYEWVTGGTTPTVGQTCAVASDLNNVKCTESCTWETDGLPYTSLTNDSVNPTGNCADFATKTVCTLSSEYQLTWESTSTQTPTGSSCSILSDAGNVRCDSSCAFVEDAGQFYISTTNDTNNPTCGQDVKRTTCVLNKQTNNWECTVEVGQITYSNCEVCTVNDVYDCQNYVSNTVYSNCQICDDYPIYGNETYYVCDIYYADVEEESYINCETCTETG